MTTARLAAETGLDPSTVSRHLAAMTTGGFARRTRTGRVVEYAAEKNVYVSFTGPLHKDRARRRRAWDHLSWRSAESVNWRFPLASRVRDPEGQGTLLRLLQRCDQTGLFHPWLRHHERLARWAAERSGDEENRIRKVLQDASLWDNLQVVVFGSCARGDARSDSDLDLLLVGPPREHWSERFESEGLPAPPAPDWQAHFRQLVDQINLGGSRYVDAIVEVEPHMVDLPDGLLKAIIKDGVTVFSSTGTDFGVEAWRLESEG